MKYGQQFLTMLLVWFIVAATCMPIFGQQPVTKMVAVPKSFLAGHSQRIIKPEVKPAFRAVSQAALPQVIQTASMETVKIRSGRGSVSYGSGVHIGGGYILSCYHTIRGTPQGSQSVQWPGGQWVPAEVVAKDARNDLSLKRVALQSVPAGRTGVQVAARQVQRSESLWLVGYPSGERLSFWSGRATGKQYSSGFCVDRWVIPGYSGGPAFDSTGSVIGVNVMSDYADSRTETLSVGPAQINDLLRPYSQAIVSARQVQCGGGGCYGGSCPPQNYPQQQYGSGGNGGYGQQVPITPALPSQPTYPQPEIQPPQNAKPQYCLPVEPIDRDKLKQEVIAEVLAQIPTPQAGRDGKDGLRGPAGPPGSSATITQAEIEQVAAIVATQMPQGQDTEQLISQILSSQQFVEQIKIMSPSRPLIQRIDVLENGDIVIEYSNGRRDIVGKMPASLGGPSFFSIEPKRK